MPMSACLCYKSLLQVPSSLKFINLQELNLDEDVLRISDPNTERAKDWEGLPTYPPWCPLHGVEFFLDVWRDEG